MNAPLWDHRCVYTLTWQRFEEGSQRLFQALQHAGYRPNVLICIVRGGLVLGTRLAHLLDISHLAVLHIQRNATSAMYPVRHPPLLVTPSLPLPEEARILIVDDIIGSGATMEAAMVAVRSSHPSMLQTMSLVINTNGYRHRATPLPDYFAFQVDDWVVFPWENQEIVHTQSLPLKEV